MFPAVLLLFVTRVLLGMEKSNQVNVMGEMALFCRSDELKYQLLNIDLLEDMRHGYAKPLKNLLQTSNDELVILSYRMCCEYNLTQTLFTKKSKEILLDQDDFHNLMKNFGDRRGAIQVTGYTGSRLKVHVYEGIRELGQGLTAISPADHLYMYSIDLPREYSLYHYNQEASLLNLYLHFDGLVAIKRWIAHYKLNKFIRSRKHNFFRLLKGSVITDGPLSPDMRTIELRVLSIDVDFEMILVELLEVIIGDPKLLESFMFIEVGILEADDDPRICLGVHQNALPAFSALIAQFGYKKYGYPIQHLFNKSEPLKTTCVFLCLGKTEKKFYLSDSKGRLISFENPEALSAENLLKDIVVSDSIVGFEKFAYGVIHNNRSIESSLRLMFKLDQTVPSHGRFFTKFLELAMGTDGKLAPFVVETAIFYGKVSYVSVSFLIKFGFLEAFLKEELHTGLYHFVHKMLGHKVAMRMVEGLRPVNPSVVTNHQQAARLFGDSAGCPNDSAPCVNKPDASKLLVKVVRPDEIKIAPKERQFTFNGPLIVRNQALPFSSLAELETELEVETASAFSFGFTVSKYKAGTNERIDKPVVVESEEQLDICITNAIQSLRLQRRIRYHTEFVRNREKNVAEHHHYISFIFRPETTYEELESALAMLVFLFAWKIADQSFTRIVVEHDFEGNRTFFKFVLQANSDMEDFLEEHYVPLATIFDSKFKGFWLCSISRTPLDGPVFETFVKHQERADGILTVGEKKKTGKAKSHKKRNHRR